MSGSLAAAGGDLDLMDAMRGRGYRAKSQAQMLREQAMSPVEIGSYNGIQGNFPVSQGFNKIAQGLLSGYMENQDRDKAQAASDAQKAEGLAFAKALQGQEAVAAQPAMDAQPGTAPMPGDTATESPQDAQKRIAMARAMMVVPPDQAQPVDPSQPTTPQGQAQGPLPAPMQGQRMEALPGQGAADDPGVVGQAAVAGQAAAPLTQAQRTAMLMQGQLSGNPGVARVAEFANKQDEVARLQAERLDARAFEAEQGRLQRAAIAGEGAANRAAQAQLVKDARQQATYEKAADLTIPLAIKVGSAFNGAGIAYDETIDQLKALRDSPALQSQVGGFTGWLPTVTEPGNTFAAMLKQIQASGGFSALKDLKASGASIGAVSNAEGQRLQDSYMALSTKMSPADFKKALNDVIDRTTKFRANLTDARNQTQTEYHRVISRAYPGMVPAPQGSAPSVPAPKPADGAPAAKGGWGAVKVID